MEMVSLFRRRSVAYDDEFDCDDGGDDDGAIITIPSIFTAILRQLTGKSALTCFSAEQCLGSFPDSMLQSALPVSGVDTVVDT